MNITEKTTEEEIRLALKNPDKFRSLFKENMDIHIAIRQFPQHAQVIIQKVLSEVLSNPKEFVRLIENSDHFMSLVFKCPNDDQKEALIQKILTNQDEFNRLIGRVSDFHLIVSNFENHINELIQMMLVPETFRRVIYDAYSLRQFVSMLPKHAEIQKLGQGDYQSALKRVDELSGKKLSAANARDIEAAMPEKTSTPAAESSSQSSKPFIEAITERRMATPKAGQHRKKAGMQDLHKEAEDHSPKKKA